MLSAVNFCCIPWVGVARNPCQTKRDTEGLHFYWLLMWTYHRVVSMIVVIFIVLAIRTNFVLFRFRRFIVITTAHWYWRQPFDQTAHGRMVLCGQRTSSVCSTQIRNEPFGSGKVKLIDAFKVNWYQKNNVLNRCFIILTDCIGCSRLGSEVYSIGAITNACVAKVLSS